MNQRKQEIIYIIFDLLVATIPFFYIILLYRTGSTDLYNLKKVVFANSLLSTLFYVSNIVMYFKIEFNVNFISTLKIVAVVLTFLGVIFSIIYPSFGWAIILFVFLDSFVTFIRGDKLREKKYIEASLINFFLHSGKLLAFILLFFLDILPRWILSNIIGYLFVLCVNIFLLKKYLINPIVNKELSLDFVKIKERIRYFIFVMLIFLLQNIEMLTLENLPFYNGLVLIKPWGTAIFIITITIGNLVLVNKKFYPYFLYLTLSLSGVFVGYLFFGKFVNYYIFNIPLWQQPNIWFIVFYLIMATILFGNYLSYINKKHLIAEPLLLFLILAALKSKILILKHLNLEKFILLIIISVFVHVAVLLLIFFFKNLKNKYQPII